MSPGIAVKAQTRTYQASGRCTQPLHGAEVGTSGPARCMCSCGYQHRTYTSQPQGGSAGWWQGRPGDENILQRRGGVRLRPQICYLAMWPCMPTCMYTFIHACIHPSLPPFILASIIPSIFLSTHPSFHPPIQWPINYPIIPPWMHASILSCTHLLIHISILPPIYSLGNHWFIWALITFEHWARGWG